MQRPGRIGTDELHLDLAPAADIALAEAALLLHDFIKQPVPALVGNEQVDKAGAGYFDLRPERVGTERRDNDFGDLPRRPLLIAGQHHCHVGSEIAVAALIRHFDNKLGDNAGAEATVVVAGLQCLIDSAA